MEQFKFSLGPYELFSAILGGAPLVLACCLLFNPVSSVQDLVPIIQANSSVAIAFAALLLSYILGGTVQGLSWRYFKRLCMLFSQDYRYFGNLIPDTNKLLLQKGTPSELTSHDFDERLVMRLRDKIGIPQEHKFLETRIAAYLREHNRQASLSQAELHLANHIMYRSWSFGFGVLSIVFILNLFRIPIAAFEPWILPIVSLGFSYLTFFRALRFKRWHNRELLLGFYFSVDEKR